LTAMRLCNGGPNSKLARMGSAPIKMPLTMS
jgi:hypothetical protein